jgi:hypothetical protein
MASHAIRDFCGLLPKAQDFFYQPLVIGITLLHGGSSILEGSNGAGKNDWLPDLFQRWVADCSRAVVTK